MSNTFHSGINAAAQANGFPLPVVKWTASPKAEIVQFKNSLTGKFAVKEATYQDCPFTLTLDYDFANNPFAATPNLTIGTILTAVRLYLAVGGDYFDMPQAIVEETPVEVEVEGKIMVTVQCSNVGPFSYPGNPLAGG